MLWLVFFFWIPLQVHAQHRSLTLEEAAALFEQNSLQQELARLGELRRRGEARQYRAFTNPEISIFSEQLNAGSLDYDETTYMISQPVELAGQPFLRNRSADKSMMAARHAFEFDRSLLVQQVKTLYTEYWYLQQTLGVYDRALAVVERVLQSAKDRQAEGTAPGIQVQRFTVEKNRYLRQRNEAELELMQAGRQLASMITSSPDPDFAIEVVTDLPVKPLLQNGEMLREYALQHRADLLALQMEAEALDLIYRVEKRERMPDLRLNVGYKNQSDGSRGFVIGGGIQLPLFNRNSGNITMAEAAQRRAETALQIKRRTIGNEVDIAYMRVQQLYAQWLGMQPHPVSPQMLETAQAAYREGHYSLVELLDATGAWTEGQIFSYRITADYHQALFKLDTLTSGTLFSTQTSTEQ
jgi:outer membrane protein, heavy metal efflux system